jgi:hypothetical protein
MSQEHQRRFEELIRELKEIHGDFREFAAGLKERCPHHLYRIASVEERHLALVAETREGFAQVRQEVKESVGALDDDTKDRMTSQSAKVQELKDYKHMAKGAWFVLAIVGGAAFTIFGMWLSTAL